MSGRRGGSAKGTKHESFSAAYWLELCEEYKSGTWKNQLAFLRVKLESEEKARRKQASFSKWLRKFEAGKLVAVEAGCSRKRKREPKYAEVEKKLIDYMELRSKLFCHSQDMEQRVGNSHAWMLEKARAWANESGMDPKYKNFRCSPGWFQNVLKRSSYSFEKLHGEAQTMDDNERKQKIEVFKSELKDLREELDVPLERIYNADQTGLFYKKLPNGIYLNENERKTVRGIKRMKAKDRITVMVCTSPTGVKLPLAYVGKYENPACFSLAPKRPPYYTHQKQAWFSRRVAIWWIKKVLDPHVQKKHGSGLPYILIMDNFSGHTNLDPTELPSNCHIVFLPPNVTSTHQPADMGMISALKVGYKTGMLNAVLDVVDNETRFLAAKQAGKYLGRGKRGLPYGNAPHVLDAIMLLDSVWSHNDGACRYAPRESIVRCWRKADILPLEEQADLNNDVGSHSRHTPKLEPSVLDDLASCMLHLQVKATAMSEAARTQLPRDIAESYVTERPLTKEQALEMSEVWYNVEENADILASEAQEELEKITQQETQTSDSDIEMEEEVEPAPNPPPPNRICAIAAFNLCASYITAHCGDTDIPSSFERLRHEVETHRIKQITQKANTTQLSIASFFNNNN